MANAEVQLKLKVTYGDRSKVFRVNSVLEVKTAVLHKFPEVPADNANIKYHDKDFGWAEFDSDVELRSGDILKLSEKKKIR